MFARYSTFSMTKIFQIQAPLFGFVARKNPANGYNSSVENACHIFAELDPGMEFTAICHDFNLSATFYRSTSVGCCQIHHQCDDARWTCPTPADSPKFERTLVKHTWGNVTNAKKKKKHSFCSGPCPQSNQFPVSPPPIISNVILRFTHSNFEFDSETPQNLSAALL